MAKLQFSGIYKTAKEIPPKQLMDYYLKGDQAERREAGNEILRRLEALERSGERMTMKLLDLIETWHNCANDPYCEYCETYNRGMAKGLNIASDSLEQMIRTTMKHSP